MYRRSIQAELFYPFHYSILLKSFTSIVEFSYLLLSLIWILNFRLCNNLNDYHIFANYRINFEAACFKLNTIKHLLFILISRGTIRERTETIVQRTETEDRVAVLKQIKNGNEPWLKRKAPHLKFNRQPRPPGVSPIEAWWVIVSTPLRSNPFFPFNTFIPLVFSTLASSLSPPSSFFIPQPQPSLPFSSAIDKMSFHLTRWTRLTLHSFTFRTWLNFAIAWPTTC